MKKILQKGEKVLHQVAHEVEVSRIKSTKIKKIIKEMSEALKSQNDGVAIAAPQIGYSLRIFTVSGKIFAKGFARKRREKSEDLTSQKIGKVEIPTPSPILSGDVGKTMKDLIFINPKISRFSREKEWMPEGCLSVRPLYGKTFRSKKVMLTAYDENGRKISRGASGLLSQIFQHETDHLNGILFVDHAKDVGEELPR